MTMFGFARAMADDIAEPARKPLGEPITLP